MSPHLPAKASSYPFANRARPNPAAGAEVVSYFLDCLGLLIRQAVQEAMQETPPAAPVAAPSLVGGMELAQEVTRLSRARIYALVSERGIPHAKRGNRLSFSRAELLAWIAEGNRQTRSRSISE